MRFKKITRCETGLQQINIVPLIDCIFLLLIFFMLTSSFVVIPGIKVKLPKVLTSEEVENLSLVVVITSEDIFYLDNKPQTLKEIEDFIQKNKYTSIFIKADRDSSFGAFAKIYDICKRLGMEKISYAITSEE